MRSLYIQAFVHYLCKRTVEVQASSASRYLPSIWPFAQNNDWMIPTRTRYGAILDSSLLNELGRLWSSRTIFIFTNSHLVTTWKPENATCFHITKVCYWWHTGYYDINGKRRLSLEIVKGENPRAKKRYKECSSSSET